MCIIYKELSTIIFLSTVHRIRWHWIHHLRLILIIPVHDTKATCEVIITKTVTNKLFFSYFISVRERGAGTYHTAASMIPLKEIQSLSSVSFFLCSFFFGCLFDNTYSAKWVTGPKRVKPNLDLCACPSDSEFFFHLIGLQFWKKQVQIWESVYIKSHYFYLKSDWFYSKSCASGNYI